jgi:elongation factor Ts
MTIQMKIDMNLIKQLREMTMAALKDCREALIEANGDIDVAHEILKKNGALKAAKKADRETNEGVVKLQSQGDMQAGIKLLCETDFVAKNDNFQALVDQLLQKILDAANAFDTLEQADASLVDDLQATIADAIVFIGENIKLEEAFATKGNAYVYNHPGNRVASVIYFEGSSEDIAKELALQVAAMNPTYVSIDEVPQAEKDKILAGERELLIQSGKPADMVDKILEGKLQKSLAEYVLLEQESIRDGSKKVKELLPSSFTVTKIARYSI